jgi:hypothetical protein
MKRKFPAVSFKGGKSIKIPFKKTNAKKNLYLSLNALFVWVLLICSIHPMKERFNILGV